MAVRLLGRRLGVTVTSVRDTARGNRGSGRGPHSPAAGIHTSCTRTLKYGWLAFALGERTTPRMKEMSKIITVEGNLASGKSKLAQKLAQRLDMLYIPQAGVDYWEKKLGDGPLLEPTFSENCSLEKFYADPKSSDGNSYRLQAWLYHVRTLQYSDALEHLLQTGQGVVLERSPYSDYVFVEAMYNQGYIRKQCVEHYNEIKGISICEFPPPHLVIYLNLPVEEVQKRLKQHGTPHEQKISTGYLQGIEDAYKKSFLPKIGEVSEVLEYSGINLPETERIIEDLELLKWDKGPWLEQDDVTFHKLRLLVENKQAVADLTIIPTFIPEITIGAHKFDEAFYTYRERPGRQYQKGYNEDVGDKWIWLK